MTDAPEMNAVDHFIALYRDGAQGCEMDADDAQVFSKALEAERADMLAAVAAAYEDAAAFLKAQANGYPDNVAWGVVDDSEEIAERTPEDALAALQAERDKARREAFRDAEALVRDTARCYNPEDGEQQRALHDILSAVAAAIRRKEAAIEARIGEGGA